MKKADIRVGELYHINEWRHQHGRTFHCAEAIEIGVHRTIYDHGYRRQSKRPDAIRMQVLVDGEALDVFLDVLPKHIIRPWAEYEAEQRQRDAEKAKNARARLAHYTRILDLSARLDALIGDQQGTVNGRTLNRVRSEWSDHTGVPYPYVDVNLATIEQLQRLVEYAERGAPDSQASRETP